MEFTDLVEVNTVELDKLPEVTDGTELYDWAKFISAKTEEELAVLAERNPQVGKAVVKLRRLSADEQTRDLYERREKARRDIESQTRWARQEGRQEGRQEEKYDMAKVMMKDKEPIEKVIRYTGLTREEVETLLQ